LGTEVARAAARVGIQQAPLSQQIKLFDGTLGAQLFPAPKAARRRCDGSGHRHCATRRLRYLSSIERPSIPSSGVARRARRNQDRTDDFGLTFIRFPPQRSVAGAPIHG